MKSFLLTLLGILLASVNLAMAQAPPAVPPAPSDTPGPTYYFLESPDPGPLTWFEAEYLLWWIKDAPLTTPLVTTGPIVGNQQPVLGQPGHRVLIGGEDVETGTRSGGRFTLGTWLDTDRTLGVEAAYFFLASRAEGQSVSSSAAPGSPFLALPFFDAAALAESSTRIALPGGFAGTATLSTTSRLEGWELNGVANLGASRFRRLELLGGFRYLNLQEEFLFRTNSPSIVLPGDIFRTRDAFDTGNHFYGGQVGLRGELGRGRWFVQGTGKVALGNMHQTVNIGGTLVTNDLSASGQTEVFPGGYLTQPTNIGRESRDRFAVIPEVNLSAGLQLGYRARLLVGYSFLYASDVVRPGDQIDRGINPVQAPAITGVANVPLTGPARPAPRCRSGDFCAHGLNFGLNLRF